MGYSFDTELTINCSDRASDDFYDLVDVIIAKLKNIEKDTEDDNEFNTSKLENVAMILVEALNANEFIQNSNFIKYVEHIHSRMEKLVETVKNAKDEDWEDAENKAKHISAYRKIIKNLKKMINRHED